MNAHAEQPNADAGELAWRVSDEVGKLSVDIADVVGDVQQVSRLIDNQTEQFHVIADATKEIVASNLQIADMAAETQRVAKQAHDDVDASHSELSKSLTDISELVDAVKAIGDQLATFETAMQSVAKVSAEIGQIARHTNILSLNATIEAARAGEAGRGFAVVASEVKSLASQTAKATDEISSHILGMQDATKESVAAIKEIGSTISQISDIASTIATAVEQQSSATQEIANNVQNVAQGTEEVANNISQVNSGAAETGAASAEVLDSAQTLSTESARLRQELDRFMSSVRAA